MDGFQRGDAVGCCLEEDVGAEDGRDDGSGGLDGLCDVDPELCIPWGASDCKDAVSKPSEVGKDEQTGHVRISCRLQRAEAASDDERGTAEAAKAPLERGGPHEECANAVEDEAEDEGGAVAEAAEDKVGIAERGEGVGAKVGCLEAGGAGAGDVEGVLEVFVEGVEEAVGEAL